VMIVFHQRCFFKRTQTRPWGHGFHVASATSSRPTTQIHILLMCQKVNTWIGKANSLPNKNSVPKGRYRLTRGTTSGKTLPCGAGEKPTHLHSFTKGQHGNTKI
jgi:hypothetical protein